jgi:hypothetical protein
VLWNLWALDKASANSSARTWTVDVRELGTASLILGPIVSRIDDEMSKAGGQLSFVGGSHKLYGTTPLMDMAGWRTRKPSLID